MTKTIFKSLIPLSILFWLPFSQGAVPPQIKKKHLQLETSASYFATNANYTEGEQESLGQGRKYENLEFRSDFEYAYRKKWSLLGSAALAYAKSENTDASRTNTEITDISAGLRYYWMRKPWRIVPEGVFSFPLNRVESGTDQVLTGEGAIFLQGGLWLARRFGRWTPYTYTGSRWRDGGRSVLAFYDLGLKLKINRDISLRGELGGWSSLTDDEFTQDPDERTDVTGRVNGGSYRYYSVNPDLIEARAWARFRTTKKGSFQFGFSQSLNGSNTASGYKLVAGYRWDWSFRKRVDPKQSDRKAFDIESSDYDETLFENEKPKKKRRKKKRRSKD